MKKHPIQPLEKDNLGTLRFKSNAIVRHLVDFGRTHGCGLNELASMKFSNEDREQLAQLIGYSLSGFSDLSYVSDETYEAASEMKDSELTSDQARIAALESKLDEVRTHIRSAAVSVFRIAPEDLQ